MKNASATFVRWIALLTTPLIVMILLFSREILTAVYGSAYAEGYLAVAIYSAGLFAYSFSQPIQGILSAKKKISITARIIVMGTLLNIALNLVFIPLYKMDGASFSSALSFLFMTALFLREEKSGFSILYEIRKPLLAGMLTVIPLLFIRPYMGDFITSIPALASGIASDITGKIIKVGILGLLTMIVTVVYLVFIVTLKALKKEDVEVISGALTRMKAPSKVVKTAEAFLLR